MRLHLLFLLLLPALAIDFQDELTAKPPPPRRLDRAELPRGSGGGGGGPGGAPDGAWQLPAGDAELRAALRSAHSAEAARHASGLTAAHLAPVLLRVLNAQQAELSARETEAFGAEVARWAARQGLGGGGGGGGGEEAVAAQGQPQPLPPPRELSASLLQQAASLRFLRGVAARLARVRSEERLRRKAEGVLERAREAAAGQRDEEGGL
jgi:hypothetical protein